MQGWSPIDARPGSKSSRACRMPAARACASTSVPRPAWARPIRCCGMRTRRGVRVSMSSSGFVETYGRADTDAQVGDLEVVPRRSLDYRGVVLEEMDFDCDSRCGGRSSVSSTSSRTPTSLAADTRSGIEDVLEFLDCGIGVMTAVNIQHLETLNDAVGRATGVRVRETVPDTFLDRADEVVNVDVTVEELRSRLRAGQGLQAGEGRTGAHALLPGRATSQRCASSRCGRWPTKWVRRRRRIDNARGWSRRSSLNASWCA